MSPDDAAVPSASLSLTDPRPSCYGQHIHFDVYGGLARCVPGSIADIAAAARRESVIIFLHGGGFAAGDKNQCAFALFYTFDAFVVFVASH